MNEDLLTDRQSAFQCAVCLGDAIKRIMSPVRSQRVQRAKRDAVLVPGKSRNN
ncbi:MAG: hypothetical protein QOH31_1852 [Verrucomicrobiota bacterium]|jgi:hypothetical protein